MTDSFNLNIFFILIRDSQITNLGPVRCPLMCLFRIERKISFSAHCLESKSYPTLIHGLKKTSKYEIAS